MAVEQGWREARRARRRRLHRPATTAEDLSRLHRPATTGGPQAVVLTTGRGGLWDVQARGELDLPETNEK